MKKAVKKLTVLLLVAIISGMCGLFTACKSGDHMYTNKTKSSKVVNKNYRIHGDNKKNGSTYRTY